MSERPPVSVLLACVESLLSSGIRSVASSNGRFHVVGEASDTSTAAALLEDLDPDVVIVDASSTSIDTAGLARGMQESGDFVPILAVFKHDDRRLDQVFRVDALGYVTEAADSRELTCAIHTVAVGRPYLCHQAIPTLIRAYLAAVNQPGNGGAERARHQSNGARITPQERRILQLIVLGESSESIAQRLTISPRTVDTHRMNLKRKLGVNSIGAMVRLAVEHRLVDIVGGNGDRAPSSA